MVPTYCDACETSRAIETFSRYRSARGHTTPKRSNLCPRGGWLEICTSTVGGVAVKPPEPGDSDGAIVALMDTGSYPTASGPPSGTAGSESTGAIAEAHRIAENVVGPWQVDAKLRQRQPTTVRPLFDARSLNLVLGDPLHLVLDDQLSGIAVAHEFIAGFPVAALRRSQAQRKR